MERVAMVAGWCRLAWRAHVAAGLESRPKQISGRGRHRVAQALPNLAKRANRRAGSVGTVRWHTACARHVRQAVRGAEHQVPREGQGEVLGRCRTVQERQHGLEEQHERREPYAEQRDAPGLPEIRSRDSWAHSSTGWMARNLTPGLLADNWPVGRRNRPRKAIRIRPADVATGGASA